MIDGQPAEAERGYYDPVAEALSSDDPAVRLAMEKRLYASSLGTLYFDARNMDISEVTALVVERSLPILACGNVEVRVPEFVDVHGFPHIGAEAILGYLRSVDQTEAV